MGLAYDPPMLDAYVILYKPPHHSCMLCYDLCSAADTLCDLFPRFSNIFSYIKPLSINILGTLCELYPTSAEGVFERWPRGAG